MADRRTRRTVLQYVGAAATAGLAGCFSSTCTDDRFIIGKRQMEDEASSYTYRFDEGTVRLSLHDVTPDEEATLDIEYGDGNRYLLPVEERDEPYDLADVDETLSYVPQFTVETVTFEEDLGPDDGTIQFQFDETVPYRC